MERLLGWAVPAILIASWQLAADLDLIDTRFFPSPWTITQTARELLASGELQHDLYVSLRRIVLGFVLGAGTGVAVGILLGISRTARAAFEPLLSALYTVPKLALLPLLLLIFGIGETPKVLLIALTVYFFVWISTMSAVMMVDDGYRDAARSLEATRLQLFRHVTVPAALPQIFVGMRVAAGVAVLILVGVEFVQGSDGLGHLIWQSWTLFIARKMYVGIVVVALLGVLSMALIKFTARRLAPWADTDTNAGRPFG